MKRIALGLTAVALTLTACQDAQQPTASFQLADGRNWTVESDWNSHFFFLAPLAETPSSFPGMFDPTAGDYLRAWVTGPWPVNKAISPPDIAGSCQIDPVEGDAFPYELPRPVLSTAGQAYATSWHPSKDTGVQPTEDNSLAYHICVSYDAAGQEIILGWRDVLPDDGGSDQPRNTAQNPLYLRDGRDARAAWHLDELLGAG